MMEIADTTGQALAMETFAMTKRGDSTYDNTIRPNEADGFERIDEEDLSLLQYSKFDSKISATSKSNKL